MQSPLSKNWFSATICKPFLVRITRFFRIVTTLFVIQTSYGQVAATYKMYSPNRQTSFETGTDTRQKLVYRVLFNGSPVTDWSAMGFVLNGRAVGEKTMVKTSIQKSIREKFAWRLGEDDTVANDYNQIILSCLSGDIAF